MQCIYFQRQYDILPDSCQRLRQESFLYPVMKNNQRQIYTTSFWGMLASLKPAAAIQTSKRPVIDPFEFLCVHWFCPKPFTWLTVTLSIIRRHWKICISVRMCKKTATNAFNFSGLTSFVVNAEEIETGAFTFCEKLTGLYFTKKYKSIGETFVIECPSRRELCDNCCLTNKPAPGHRSTATNCLHTGQCRQWYLSCRIFPHYLCMRLSAKRIDLFLKAAVVTFRLHG